MTHTSSSSIFSHLQFFSAIVGDFLEDRNLGAIACFKPVFHKILRCCLAMKNALLLAALGPSTASVVLIRNLVNLLGNRLKLIGLDLQASVICFIYADCYIIAQKMYYFPPPGVALDGV